MTQEDTTYRAEIWYERGKKWAAQGFQRHTLKEARADAKEFSGYPRREKTRIVKTVITQTAVE